MYSKNLHRDCKLLIQQACWLQVDDTHSAMAKVQDRSKRKRAFMTRAVKSSLFSTRADPAEGETHLAALQADQKLLVHLRTRGRAVAGGTTEQPEGH